MISLLALVNRENSARAADGLFVDRGECAAYSLVLIVGPWDWLVYPGCSPARYILILHTLVDFDAVPE